MVPVPVLIAGVCWYQRDNLYEGKFAFTTDSEGDVTTCFKNNGPPRYKVTRSVRGGEGEGRRRRGRREREKRGGGEREEEGGGKREGEE